MTAGADAAAGEFWRQVVAHAIVWRVLERGQHLECRTV